MQLTDEQLFERCQCGHARARHYGMSFNGEPVHETCDRCYCPRFTLAEGFTAEERAVARRPLPSDPIDEFAVCKCLCRRGEHQGPLMLGKCTGCSCQRFLQRSPETEEAEIRLLNTALEQVFEAMVRPGRKAA
jgi:hypothetical protein